MGSPPSWGADRHSVALQHPRTAALLSRYARHSLYMFLIGIVLCLPAVVTRSPQFELLMVAGFPLVGGCVGLVRAATRWAILRRHPWVKLHQRTATLNWTFLNGHRRLEATLVMLPEFDGDRPYLIKVAAFRDPPSTREGFDIWVAGRPGHGLVYTDRRFTGFGQLRPARTAWTKSRWSVAFTDPALAAREPTVRTAIVWSQRIDASYGDGPQEDAVADTEPGPVTAGRRRRRRHLRRTSTRHRRPHR